MALYYSRPWLPEIYSNSTICYGEVRIDGLAAMDDDEVGAFVGEECRGVGYVRREGSEALVTLNIQGEEVETVHFAVYDISESTICTVTYYTLTNPGGDIGYPPAEIPIYAYSSEGQETEIFPRPWDVVNYTNSTVAYCLVTIDGSPASFGDEVGAFVENECRGVGVVVDNSRETISSLNIQGESVETVNFAVYDLSANSVYGVSYSTLTNPGGDIGYPPNMLPIAALSNGGTGPDVFPRPWNMVTYTNSTVAYCDVTINGSAAAAGDEVGVFVDSECRGVGNVVMSGSDAISTVTIQGESVETVNFAVYDLSANSVYGVSYSTLTNPGNDIGYPPNLLPVAASSSRGSFTLREDFPLPWNVVNYTNSTVAYCNVTIDGELATEEDQVGAFVGSECRGVGDISLLSGQSISSLNIQGESAETVSFAVYDYSADAVINVSYTTMTNPGNDIGYPPDLLPIAAATEVVQELANCFSGETLDVIFPIGEYEVTLTVTDDDGATDSEITTVTVLEYNEAPVADAGGPYEESAEEGGTICLCRIRRDRIL